MLYIFLWFFGSIVVGGIGAERTCGFLRGFFLSIFLSPIIGGIMVAFCPRKKSTAELLSDAKVYLDSGVVTKEEYDAMVQDVAEKGKLYSIRHYKKGIVDPLSH